MTEEEQVMWIDGELMEAGTDASDERQSPSQGRDDLSDKRTGRTCIHYNLNIVF